MTPARLRECLDALGWSQRELARVVGVHYSHAHRWASGRWEIPDEVADRVERVMRSLPGDDADEALMKWKGAVADCLARLEARIAALEKQVARGV